ncbi:porin [Pelagibacteraceae bacterium]|nr:porin [Pelagibacteraceae bacterium]
MKNILKTIAVLFSVSLISVVAKAGELAVSGSAKASYVISGGEQNTGKGLGISNELMFKASGELDNGFTWDYHTELDMADGGAASNDDTALVFGLGDLGKFGIYDAEGGLSTELGYGIGAMGTGADYTNTMTNIGWGFDVSADPHVAYYTPAGLLPFGVEAAIGYAPNTGDGQGNSYKNAGGAVAMDADGSTATQYKVTAAPIDGLKIGADYYETGGNIATGTVTEKTGGNVYAQYAMGNFKVGIYSGELETAKADKYATASADSATVLNGDMYESDGYGIEFAVNDSLSISYNSEEFARIDKTMATTASTSTKTTVTSEQNTIMAAYTMGGATVGISMIDTNDADYTAAKDENKTVLSLALEF